ncbi:hypothetical protein [Aliamphritea hakodatensis]|uniref:hypothetical protein n=1 Tax=Aliamphritea hakodatensis TaxID=2895352 RepID=UPI0022FD7649|nr:hypothetical protein [Aliamphritea hakodatensis]
MIVIGVTGSDSLQQKRVAEALVGRESPVIWSFSSAAERVAGALFGLSYRQMASDADRGLRDSVFGESPDGLVDWVRDFVPVEVWRQGVVKRLKEYPPCQYVVLTDLTEEWQAKFVRDCGGLIIHITACEFALDTPVNSEIHDIEYDPAGLSLDWLRERFSAWTGWHCSSFDWRRFVSGRGECLTAAGTAAGDC